MSNKTPKEIFIIDEFDEPDVSTSAAWKASKPGRARQATPLASFSTKGWSSKSTGPSGLRKSDSVYYVSDSSSPGLKRSSSDASIVKDAPPPDPKRVRKLEYTPVRAAAGKENVGPSTAPKDGGRKVAQAISVEQRARYIDSCRSLKEIVMGRILEHYEGGPVIDLDIFKSIQKTLTERIDELQSNARLSCPTAPITHANTVPVPKTQDSWSPCPANAIESDVTLVEPSFSMPTAQRTFEPIEVDDDDDDDAGLWGQMDDVDLQEISEVPAFSLPSVSQPLSSGPDPSTLRESPYYPEVKSQLKRVFRLDSFRKNQLEAVIAAMEGRDVFVLMPTGGGKSLCYQLPAVCTEGPRKGVSIVITPLVALMNDQVGQLRNKYKVAAALWNADNQLSHQELSSLRQGAIRLLYVTPEKLQGSNYASCIFKELYDRNLVARFVIDEAHCISTWGQDFREAYTTLGSLRDQYPNVPIIALTATANRRTVDDIVSQLQLRNHVALSQSFNRPNLTYQVLSKGKTKDAIADMILSKYRDKSGIVYCRARDSCEKVAAHLIRRGIFARHYHAGIPKDEREQVANDWQENQIHVVVATIAFGMGIDKPDVRFVIHHDMPKCISGYYQETGRAGRDGLPSDCIMYYNLGDLNSTIRMIKGDEKTTPEAKARQEADLRVMFNFAYNQSDCRRVQLLQHFDERFDPAECRKSCDTCNDPRETISQDVTAISKAAVQLVRSANAAEVTFTSGQLTSALRGSLAADMKSKGADKMQGFGGAKDWPSELTDLVLKHLVYEDILVMESVMNGNSKFHIETIELGGNVSLIDKGERIVVKWRPKNGGKGTRTGANESTSAAKTVRRRKPGKSGTELADDPIEDDDPWSFPGESQAGPSRLPSISSAPHSTSRQPKPPSKSRTPSDPAEGLHSQLGSVRSQIAREHGIKPQEVVDDQVLEMIALMPPNDYQAFKNVVSDNCDVPSPESYASRVWEMCGQNFLEVCIKSNTGKSGTNAKRPATATRNVAELQGYSYSTPAAPTSKPLSSSSAARPAAYSSTSAARPPASSSSATGRIRPSTSAPARTMAPAPMPVVVQVPLVRTASTASMISPAAAAAANGVPRVKKFIGRK